VVAIPTDTVYGLAAALDQPAAIARLYDIKNRPRSKAIPVLLANLEDAARVSPRLPPLARALAARFWPGALTLVVPALDGLPAAVTAADARQEPTVAIRVPRHELARQVIALAGGALAVTSANLSGDMPAVDAEEILLFEMMQPDAVLDGGRAPGGTASTVLLAIGGEPRVLREGAVSSAEIAEAVQSYLRQPASGEESVAGRV
jgi:L-threonylcarbamoyladenylate synthase